MILARIIPYALVGAVSGYLFFTATQIEFHRRAGTLGPDVWPKLVLALLIATCLYEIVRIVLVRGRRGGAAGVLQEMVEESEAKLGGGFVYAGARSPWTLAAGIALTALYVWVIQQLGFFLATAAYVFAFIALGGYRRWGVNAAVSLIGTTLMMFFFMKVVYVSLPLGQGPFAQFTFWLMRLMGIR